MTRDPSLTLLGRLAAILSVTLLVYWGLFAALSPAMNLDGQMYDVSRITLAWRGGFFSNGLFTSLYQVIWPWGFDAVSLPFVLAGWGYAIPSFLCLLGIVTLARQWARDTFGADAGWLAALGLLGLTCLVYQGTTTKNDIPIAFAGAVWLYARSRWRQSLARSHLLWMAVAIGVMAGSKTTGVMIGGILSVWTLIECWRFSRTQLARAGIEITLALLLLGSIETYLETYRIFGHLLGPAELIDSLRVRPGVAAFFGNGVRVAAGSIWDVPGMEHFRPILARRPPAQAWWHGLPVRSLQFEEFAGYGLVGALGLLAMGASLVVWQRRLAWWRLAIGAVAAMALVALTVQFNTSVNRYLTPAFALATVACVAALWECPLPLRSALRWIFAAVAAVAALTAPFVSFNRGPAELVHCVTDRKAMEGCCYPLGLRTRARLEHLEAVAPDARIFYVVASNSFVEPYLDTPALPVTLVTPLVFSQLLEQHALKTDDLILEDVSIATEKLVRIETISAPNPYFPDSSTSTSLYRVKSR